MTGHLIANAPPDNRMIRSFHPSSVRDLSGPRCLCRRSRLLLLPVLWDASDDNMKEAEVASRKAVELDPELTEAYVARGFALRMNKKYEEAHKEFETAIQLNPKLFDAYYFYARLPLSARRTSGSCPILRKGLLGKSGRLSGSHAAWSKPTLAWAAN
jgi:tetratricopeptide (TPR) repeat protein